MASPCIVVLLMHFEGLSGEIPSDLGTGFIDAMGRHALGFCTGGPQTFISLTPSMFGHGSVSVDGGAELRFGDSADWDFGADNFTIEAHLYLTGMPQAIPGTFGASIWSKDGSAAVFSPVNWTIGQDRKFHLWASTTGTSWNLFNDVPGANAISLNARHHLALDRDGNTWRMFIDGALDFEATGAGTLMTNAQFAQSGRFQNLLTSPHWFMDELRVTKGTAWYTAPFDPPAVPFSDTGCLPPIGAPSTKLLEACSGFTVCPCPALAVFE